MDGRLRIGCTGCGAAWLARLLWEQEAAGSNPAIPTNLWHCRSWHARAPIWPQRRDGRRVRDRLLMAGWRSRSAGQTRWGQLALSAVAVAFLIAAIWLGGKLTYRYGMRVTRQADHDGKLRLDGLAGDWSADSGRAGTPALQGIERLRQLLRSRAPATTWAAGSQGCPRRLRGISIAFTGTRPDPGASSGGRHAHRFFGHLFVLDPAGSD